MMQQKYQLSDQSLPNCQLLRECWNKLSFDYFMPKQHFGSVFSNQYQHVYSVEPTNTYGYIFKYCDFDMNRTEYQAPQVSEQSPYQEENQQSEFKLNDSIRQDGIKVSKKFWTKKEDERLITLVQKYGQVRWTQISMQMPGRSAKRCRQRWMNYLDQSKNHSQQWTDDEKWLLFLLYKTYGNKWSVISKIIKRGDNIIKNQVNCLKRKKMMPYQNRLKEILKYPGKHPNLQTASKLEKQLIQSISSKTKVVRMEPKQPPKKVQPIIPQRIYPARVQNNEAPTSVRFQRIPQIPEVINPTPRMYEGFSSFIPNMLPIQQARSLEALLRLGIYPYYYY